MSSLFSSIVVLLFSNFNSVINYHRPSIHPCTHPAQFDCDSGLKWSSRVSKIALRRSSLSSTLTCLYSSAMSF